MSAGSLVSWRVYEHSYVRIQTYTVCERICSKDEMSAMCRHYTVHTYVHLLARCIKHDNS